MTFSCAVTLNPLVYLMLSMNPWPMHSFVTSWIDHAENMSSLGYTDLLPNVLLYSILKIAIVNKYQQTHKKSLF